MPTSDLQISYVVPAYNEQGRIAPTLDAALQHLRDTGMAGEIIVVDDGSTDGTADLVADYAATHPRVRLLRNDANRGKGYSVRRGALDAEGEVVLFTDADGSTPMSETPKLLAPIAAGEADVAIGSRELPGSQLERPQPRYRRFIGGACRWLVRLIAIGGFRDTQCGFKAFRRDVAQEVFSRQTLDGFAFDVELLVIARRLGYRILEVPVRWLDSSYSRVSPLADSARMLRDLFRIRLQARRGIYDPKPPGRPAAGPRASSSKERP